MQQPPSAAGVKGWPIGIRIADAPLVRGMVGDIFGDERAALFGWTNAAEKGKIQSQGEGVDLDS